LCQNEFGKGWTENGILGIYKGKNVISGNLWEKL
jgi:hypothetical protein